VADAASSLPARLVRALNIVEDALLVILLGAMVVVAGAQIVLRNLFDGALLWADPLLRVAVLWVGMIGAMVATRGDRQITVDVVSRFLPDRWRAGIRVLTDLFTAVVAALVAWSAYRLMLEDRSAGGMAIAFVPVWVCEAVLPLAFAVISLRYLAFAFRHLQTARASLELE
jgi:C4-dicarboxylate transporter DctQ subunit